MRTAVKPVKMKRRYGPKDWVPVFVWLPFRMEFSIPGAPKDVNGETERVYQWVWLEWIERQCVDGNGRPPYNYRLKAPE